MEYVEKYARCQRQIVPGTCHVEISKLDFFRSGPADRSQEQGNECNDDQHMDNAGGAIVENAKQPTNDQYNGDKV